METLNQDVATLITSNLHNNKDKLAYLSASNFFNNIKSDILFNQKTNYNKVKDLEYFNHFTHLRITNKCMLPEKINKLTFGYYFDADISGFIPKTVNTVIFEEKNRLL
jgi:hypothetical protein